MRASRLRFENDEKQKAEVQTLGSSGEGMRLTDSVAVECGEVSGQGCCGGTLCEEHGCC